LRFLPWTLSAQKGGVEMNGKIEKIEGIGKAREEKLAEAGIWQGKISPPRRRWLGLDREPR